MFDYHKILKQKIKKIKEKIILINTGLSMRIQGFQVVMKMKLII